MSALATEHYNQADFLASFDIAKVPHHFSKNMLVNATGWTYLIADNICFTDKQDHAIHLPKPDDKATLMSWLEKIAESGNTQNVFVEGLELSEAEALRLLNIFNFYGVRLINIGTQNTNQLVYGLWD